MPKFDFDLQTSLGDLANSKLGDDLKSDIAVVQVTQPFKSRSKGFFYELGSNLSFRLELFNSETDKDSAHKVLGKTGSNTGSQTVSWKALVEPGKHGVWLKYTTSAGIKPAAKFDFGPVLGIRGNQSLDHFYYHKHSRSQRLGVAVIQDMAAQKCAFCIDDVRTLNKSEALGFASAGNVQFSLTISWSDILASGASSLASLTDGSEAVEFRMSANARASFNLALKDDFKLVFVGLGNDTVRMGLRKSESSTFKVGTTLGVEARLGKSSAVTEILDTVLAGLLGVSLTEFRKAVKSLQNHVDLKTLPPVQREITQQMLERLNLADKVTSTAALLSKLSQLEKQASKQILSIAVNKAKMSFANEYSQIQSDASIMEADLSVSSVKRLFDRLIAGRFEALLAESEKFPGEIRIRRFLNQKSLHIKHALGLSLGMGRWSISGKESTSFKLTSQKKADHSARHAITGSRQYSGTWLGSKWSTEAKFTAHMEDFKPAKVMVSVDDFSLGLSLIYTWNPSRTRKSKLCNMVDTSLLWGAGPEEDIDRLVEKLATIIPGNSSSQSKALLSLGNSEVRAFSRWMAESPSRNIAEAMASAMPYWKLYPQTLEIRYRRQIYRRIWEQWLSDPFTTAAEASAYAYSVLRRYNTSLANEERKARKSGKTAGYTVYRSFKLNRDMLLDFRRTQAAFARLDTAIREKSSYQELKPVTRDILRFANTPYKTRALGALMLAWFRSRPSTSMNIATSLSIKHNRKKGKFTDVYVIGHKS